MVHIRPLHCCFPERKNLFPMGWLRLSLRNGIDIDTFVMDIFESSQLWFAFPQARLKNKPAFCIKD